MSLNKEIMDYLGTKTINAGFIDTLKIKYRPLICPFDLLLSYVKDKKTVFDIGCGSGQFISLVAKFTNAVKIKGVEIDDHLIKNATEIGKEFKGKKELIFSVFDGKSLPLDMKNYEIVFIIDVIHHIPPVDQEEFIREIYNKMAHNSTLVFKDINASHPFVFFNKIHDLIFAGRIGKEISFLNAGKMLRKTGFQIQEMGKKTTFLYPHYYFLCTK